MNLREVCRLLLTTDFSNREVARAAEIAPNTAGRYRTRLAEEGLDWNGVAALTDRAIEERLNNGRQLARKAFVERLRACPCRTAPARRDGAAPA